MTERKIDKVVASTSRRDALRTVGLSAIALATSQIAGQASAATTITPMTANLDTIAAKRLSVLDSSELSSLRLTARLPVAVQASDMGLTAKGVSTLTEAARSLTKADLEALGRGSTAGRLAALTVSDVQSISEAFANYYAPGQLVADGRGDQFKKAGHTTVVVKCCCCSPCCCAAAVVEPIKLAA